ncbi:hapless 2-like [Rousettus aegyptiacus]|uniref:hapless 2-like n=1 Tax=Rousettus aegyptiacus TaxID=9407 RepID=UPI00168D2A0A|nr:hapless 2-like [Rousettus aegyptiacus]
MQGGGGGRGRAGGGKRGRSLNDQGTGPVRKEPSQSPSALLRALSHGVLEQKGAGWPDWLACPWGQREGPRPARGAARSAVLLPGPPLPSRVPRQGMSCSRRSLPGARGQGGLGGVLASSSPHLLPAQVRAEPPPPLPPLTHAAPGLARRGAWDGVRGWGSRRHLAAVPRAHGAPGGRWAPSRFTAPPPACGPPCRGCGGGALARRAPSGSGRVGEKNRRPLLYIASCVGLLESSVRFLTTQFCWGWDVSPSPSSLGAGPPSRPGLCLALFPLPGLTAPPPLKRGRFRGRVLSLPPVHPHAHLHSCPGTPKSGGGHREGVVGPVPVSI